MRGKRLNNRRTLARQGLIDEYQILVTPIVIGKGKTMFEGITDRIVLKLITVRRSGNGNVFAYSQAMT